MKTFLLFVLIGLFLSTISAIKVTANLEKVLKQKKSAPVFIKFKKAVKFDQLQKSMSFKFTEMDEITRGRVIVDALKAVSKNSQKNVVKFLKAKNIEFKAFWIVNAIALRQANYGLIEFLGKSFNVEIEQFELVDEAHIIDPVSEQQVVGKKNQRIEAGVSYVKAPEVWAQGYTGQGIVVGVIDSGTFLHRDLIPSYRGRDGNHEENWLDATRLARREPYDDNFHGTHCQGTINGNTTTETVGVAPGSEWVSCKFLTRAGSGNYADCLECYQFMLAPNNNPDIRPHVVSNSYGGGTPPSSFEDALDALEAAGVEMVFAAGNSGSRCSSVLLPALYAGAFSVGATQRNSDRIASFSSRGPGRNRQIKPEISAPGSSVRSTTNRQNSYRSASGTSMACPHVAGVIALLWSAKPELSRNIQETRRILTESARSVNSNLCSSSGSPNNVFGNGIVDAVAALEAAGVNLDRFKLSK